MIKLIVYTNLADKSAKRLEKEVLNLDEKNIEILHNIEGLKKYLKQPHVHTIVIVLLIYSYKELLKIQSFNSLFTDVRLVLILPDSRKDTIAISHSLFPRFITYSNSDFKDLGAVLSKMCCKF